MWSPGTDQELLERWQRDGNAADADMLVQRHYARLLNLFYRLSGKRSQAEELTQDLFLRLTEQVARGGVIRQPGPWLNATALNLWRDRIRRELRARAKGIAESGGDEEIENLVISANFSTREEELQSRLEQQSVRDAIMRLAPKHREVVVLYHYQGMKYEEIAHALAIPVGTVRSRLHYAVEELHTLLSPMRKGCQ